MAEVKKAAPVAVAKAALTPAGESSDPTVQFLLAQRQALATQDQNHAADIEAAQAEIDARKSGHDAIAAQLAELGYQ